MDQIFPASSGVTEPRADLAATQKLLDAQGYRTLTRNDEVIIIRLARPDDEHELRAMFSQCTAEDFRLRCLGIFKDFTRFIIPHLCHPVGDSEMTLVAESLDPQGAKCILGVVHLVRSAENSGEAEFDVMVRSDHKGEGIGFELMKDILAVAKAKGLTQVIGHVLCANESMLQMTHELGFSHEFVGDGVVRTTLSLSPRAN